MRTFERPRDDLTLERLGARTKVERYFGDIPAGPEIDEFETWVPVKDTNSHEIQYDQVPAILANRVWAVAPRATRDWRDWIYPLLVIACGLAAWQLAVMAGWLRPIQFPPPSKLAASFVELWVEGEHRLHDRARWQRVIASAGDGRFQAEPWQHERLQP